MSNERLQAEAAKQSSHVSLSAARGPPDAKRSTAVGNQESFTMRQAIF